MRYKNYISIISGGYTLIELMIVVGILGILISIAVPNYQQHIVSARVIEGLNLAGLAKIAVAESAMNSHSLPNNQAMTGYVSPAPTANVAAITIGNQGIITIAYTTQAGGGTMLLQPNMHENGELTWDCKAGSLDKKYRPSACR